MVGQYTEEIIASLEVTIYDVLSTTIAADGILPTNRFELQSPVHAVSAICFLNNFPYSSTLIVKTAGRCDKYLYYS